MRSFETETNQMIDIRSTNEGKVIVAIDGEVFVLTSGDAYRLSKNLDEAANIAHHAKLSGISVSGTFA